MAETGVIVVKEIKPARLKEDAMRLALLSGMGKVARGIVKDFKKTTETWETEVKWDVKKSLSRQHPSPLVIVSTTNRIFAFVNDGTDPHPIFAGIYTGRSDKKALSFKGGKYKAKTKPGILGSFAGGASGKRVAVAYVDHPGTKPRKFDEKIQRKWEPRFKREMEKAMREAAKVSGHSVT